VAIQVGGGYVSEHRQGRIQEFFEGGGGFEISKLQNTILLEIGFW